MLLEGEAAAPADFPVPPVGGDWDIWLGWARVSPGTVAWGIEPQEMADGHAKAILPRSVLPLADGGTVSAALLAAVADQVGAMAVLTRLPKGIGAVTGTLNVEYFAPGTLPLTIVATVGRDTSALAFVTVRICGKEGDVAVASGMWVLLDYPTGTVELQ